jgi:hypothetical protein
MEENVHPEGYNSLPLRRKNCKKYRRASDVHISKRQIQDGRLCASLYGAADHMTGPRDCRFHTGVALLVFSAGTFSITLGAFQCTLDFKYRSYARNVD